MQFIPSFSCNLLTISLCASYLPFIVNVLTIMAINQKEEQTPTAERCNQVSKTLLLWYLDLQISSISKLPTATPNQLLFRI